MDVSPGELVGGEFPAVNRVGLADLAQQVLRGRVLIKELGIRAAVVTPIGHAVTVLDLSIEGLNQSEDHLDSMN